MPKKLMLGLISILVLGLSVIALGCSSEAPVNSSETSESSMQTITPQTSAAAPISTEQPPTSTTSTTTVSVSTTSGVQPFIDGPGVAAALEVVSDYFSCLRSGNSADFEKLIDPAPVGAATLYRQERAQLAKSNEAAYAPHFINAIVWAGDRYLIPTVKIPESIDQWVRASPHTRLGCEVIMMDDSVRYVRLERQMPADTWLVVRFLED